MGKYEVGRSQLGLNIKCAGYTYLDILSIYCRYPWDLTFCSPNHNYSDVLMPKACLTLRRIWKVMFIGCGRKSFCVFVFVWPNAPGNGMATFSLCRAVCSHGNPSHANEMIYIPLIGTQIPGWNNPTNIEIQIDHSFIITYYYYSTLLIKWVKRPSRD